MPDSCLAAMRHCALFVANDNCCRIFSTSTCCMPLPAAGNMCCLLWLLAAFLGNACCNRKWTQKLTLQSQLQSQITNAISKLRVCAIWATVRSKFNVWNREREQKEREREQSTTTPTPTQTQMSKAKQERERVNERAHNETRTHAKQTNSNWDNGTTSNSRSPILEWKLKRGWKHCANDGIKGDI